MREVRVEDAVGMILAHDLTRIVPGEFKGVAFPKGHQIQEEDIPALLDIGKAHIYVLDDEPGMLHEDTAAQRLAAALGAPGLLRKGPHEGKITLQAPYPGIVQVDVERLFEVNSISEIVISTKRDGDVVGEQQSIASLRAVPLMIQEEKICRAEEIASTEASPILDVLPFRSLSVGIVSTGSEILTGRIQDAFGPVLRDKLSAFHAAILGQKFVGDDPLAIEEGIREFINQGADLVIATGGMSVDPDDRTPGAISRVATEVITYGMPILPGSMTMVAYHGNTPIFGLPGAVIHDKKTAFDLLLPRICAGQKLTRSQIVRLGHGGLLG